MHITHRWCIYYYVYDYIIDVCLGLIAEYNIIIILLQNWKKIKPKVNLNWTPVIIRYYVYHTSHYCKLRWNIMLYGYLINRRYYLNYNNIVCWCVANNCISQTIESTTVPLHNSRNITIHIALLICARVLSNETVCNCKQTTATKCTNTIIMHLFNWARRIDGKPKY